MYKLDQNGFDVLSEALDGLNAAHDALVSAENHFAQVVQAVSGNSSVDPAEWTGVSLGDVMDYYDLLPPNETPEAQRIERQELEAKLQKAREARDHYAKNQDAPSTRPYYEHHQRRVAELEAQLAKP